MESTRSASYQTEPVLFIHTLGGFDVKKNGQSLVATASGSRKLWDLYKFMVTHRKRTFTPEALIDSLWPSEDYSDPRSTLRRQMHRLRQLLGEKDGSQSPASILFSNGFYRWNPETDVRIDAEEFESCVQLGDLMKDSQDNNALIHYRKALELYAGDYLPECMDQTWIFPVRSHYRRLYIRAFQRASSMLADSGSFQELLDLAEKAIEIDVYEEDFHLAYMEALLQLEQRKRALEYYEQITGFFYRELGLKPSPSLRNLYKRILATQATLDSAESLQADLDPSTSPENAYFCQPDVFRSIYELERRRSERSGVQAVVGIISMNHPVQASQGKRQQRMMVLQQHLLHHLRKGDTVTRWNDAQFLVLLPGLNTETMESVLRRVVLRFPRENPEDLTRIQTHCHMILPNRELVAQGKTD